MEFFQWALSFLKMMGGRAYRKKKQSSRTSSKLLKFAGYLLVLVLVFAHGLMAVEAQHAAVIVPVANMYSAPTENVDVVSQAILGSNMEVLEQRPGWEKVRTADQYTGWMLSQDMRMLQPSDVGYATSGRIAQVRSLTANLYHETDVTQHRPILPLPFETRLEV